MIDILLATYNGETYLRQQIDSILGQSAVDWRLLIHDDGSRDGTLAIICEYQNAHPGRIVWIDDGISSLGAKDNFAHLMTHCDAEYVMFCDQDDVWEPDKMSRSLEAMREMEAERGPAVPVAVFSDLHLIDTDGRTIATSGWRQMRINPALATSTARLAVRNCITGCTLMINRSALAVSLPLPPEAVMHDWWIGLCILRSGGRLRPIHQSLVRYRQHAANVVGAARFRVVDRLAAALDVFRFLRSQDELFQMARCSGAITNRVSFTLIKLGVLVRTMLGAT